MNTICTYLNSDGRYKHLRSLCFCCVVLFPLFIASSIGANAGGMELKTTTEFNSAEICQRLKEGPSITQTEIESDLHRTTVGIGEVITLELIDQSDPEKVTWSYTDPAQAQYAILAEPTTGKKKITLTVQRTLTEDASVGVKVTNEFGESREVTFSLKIPRSFKGKHIPSDAGEGTIPTVTDKDGNMVEIQPGQTGSIGTAGSLAVKISPTDVSFANIHVIERANDPQGFRPIHTPNSKPQKLNDSNDFGDKVFAAYLSSGTPKGWTWNCLWKVHNNGQDGLLISGRDVPQTITFESTNHGNASGVRTTINKFGCSVSRDSCTGQYNFENPKE